MLRLDAVRREAGRVCARPEGDEERDQTEDISDERDTAKALQHVTEFRTLFDSVFCGNAPGAVVGRCVGCFLRPGETGTAEAKRISSLEGDEKASSREGYVRAQAQTSSPVAFYVPVRAVS